MRSRYSVLDLAALVFAPLLAFILRNDIVLEADGLISLIPYTITTLIVSVPIYVIFGIDKTLWIYATISDYARIIAAVALIVVAATILTFLFDRMSGISRSIPVLQGLISVSALAGGRLLASSFGNRRSPSTRSTSGEATGFPHADTLLVVGVNRLTLLLLEALVDMRAGKVRVAGIIALDAVTDGRTLKGFDVYGPENLASTLQMLSLHGLDVDQILITVPPDQLPETVREALAKIIESATVKVEYLSNAFDLINAPNLARRSSLALCPALEALTFDHEKINRIENASYWGAKRVLDVTGAALLLIVLAPVWLALIIVVWSTLGAPVYFWQVRPGRYGCPIKLVKFRTLSNPYDANGRPIDMANRLGSVGRILRKTRLDELPQLWNVLRGEMSFVGPRPLLPVDQTAGASQRHLVRPGLTGYAQVMGGRDISPADKMALDLWYVLNASFVLDLKIIARTIPMVIFGEGINHEAIRAAWADLRANGAPASRVSTGDYFVWISKPLLKILSDRRALMQAAMRRTAVTTAHERRHP